MGSRWWHDGSMRLFAALRPPSEALDHLQVAVDAVVPPWRGGGPSPLRWTDPEQRHVTLAFFGEVPGGAADELTAELAAVAARWDPFEAELAGAGVFSGSALWVGLQTDVDIVPFMAECEAAGAGISRLDARDRRRAHLTVARLGRRGRQGRGGRRGERDRGRPEWAGGPRSPRGGEWSGRRGGWADDGAAARGSDWHRGSTGRQAGPARTGRSREPGGPARPGEVDLDAVVHALSVYRGPVWQATQLDLVSSVLGEGRGGGPRHEVLATLPLGAGRAG